MDDLEKYYGKMTFGLYALFAKVPGKKVWPRVIFLTISISILLWATVIQVISIVIERFKRRVVIELLPTTMTTFGCLFYIPYVVCSMEEDVIRIDLIFAWEHVVQTSGPQQTWMKERFWSKCKFRGPCKPAMYNVFKALVSMMKNDLKDERTEVEDAIKRQYYRDAKILVNGYSLLCGLGFCTVCAGGLSPYILDVLIPLNETRERWLLIRAEFFVDEEKYYYYIYFLECSAAFVVGVVIIVTENVGIIIGQHAYGMTAVLGFANLIVAFYDIPLTLVLVGTFCVLTISLVQVTNPELMNTANVMFTIVQVFQLYILSYLGQRSINYAEKLTMSVNNVKWYLCSINQRKILQLIILRATKPCVITARNMYALSMENFLSVMQTVTSFYMVLRQTE